VKEHNIETIYFSIPYLEPFFLGFKSLFKPYGITTCFKVSSSAGLSFLAAQLSVQLYVGTRESFKIFINNQNLNISYMKSLFSCHLRLTTTTSILRKASKLSISAIKATYWIF